MPHSGHLWYQDSGAGHPVFFVHGWCMSSDVWELQVKELSNQYRCIRLDLRGHGKSASPQDGLSGFSAYGQDIVRLVQDLNLTNVIAVGWSLGAQALLKAYPDIASRVAGMVLVGATPRFSAAPHFPYGLPPQQAEGMRLKVRRSLDRALAGFHRNLFVEGELADASAVRAAEEVLNRVVAPDQASALSGLEALMEEELLAESRQVNCPTMLVHGDQDPVCLPAASAWLTEQIPDSRRILFEGCGHAPFISRAGAFNRALVDFMRGLPCNE